MRSIDFVRRTFCLCFEFVWNICKHAIRFKCGFSENNSFYQVEKGGIYKQKRPRCLVNNQTAVLLLRIRCPEENISVSLEVVILDSGQVLTLTESIFIYL